jgi:exonuclease III
VKLATWNVNSLKVRLPRVLEFLAEHEPDVICLQETKSEAEAFPVDELAQAGYLLLASDALAGSLIACGIARNHRKGSKPSDHAPPLLELEESP